MANTFRIKLPAATVATVDTDILDPDIADAVNGIRAVIQALRNTSVHLDLPVREQKVFLVGSLRIIENLIEDIIDALSEEE